MTQYTYSINYTDRFGETYNMGMGTEEQMFASALQLDKEGAMLQSVFREVWEVANGIAHLVRVEPYRNGKPVTS